MVMLICTLADMNRVRGETQNIGDKAIYVDAGKESV
jgi:hypothetical protein